MDGVSGGEKTVLGGDARHEKKVRPPASFTGFERHGHCLARLMLDIK